MPSLTAIQRLKPSTDLPQVTFGRLVGSFDHWTYNAHDGNRQNKNHIYLWLNCNDKFYECAVNTESDDFSEVEFASFTQVDTNPIPADGFQSEQFSFSSVDGLSQSSFRELENSDLRDLVSQYAVQSKKIAVYGVTYNTGDGIHDVHQNSGEPGGSSFEERVDQDGALAFYSDGPKNQTFVRWIFIKFQTQSYE